MSLVRRHKHTVQAVLREPLCAPAEHQRVVRVVAGRGNNLLEVCPPSGAPFLVSVPTRFRRSLWVKRGDYVLIDPIDEGDKVKGEMAMLLTAEHRRFYNVNGWWPKEFSLPGRDDSSSASSGDDSDSANDSDDFGLPRNTNRPTCVAPESSSECSSDDSDTCHVEEESSDDEKVDGAGENSSSKSKCNTTKVSCSTIQKHIEGVSNMRIE